LSVVPVSRLGEASRGPREWRQRLLRLFRDSLKVQVNDLIAESEKARSGYEVVGGDEDYFRAVAEFAYAGIYEKGLRGAKEHGGSLSSKPVQHEVWGELFDIFSYFYTLSCVQIPKARMHLEEAILARVEGNQVDVARHTKKALNVLTYGNVDGPLED
jgi:hypothetical protein